MKEKLRILQLGHKCVPSRSGGVEVVVGELSKRMAKKGHDVTLYNRSAYLKEDEDLFEKELYQQIKIKQIPTIQKRGLAAMSSSITGAVCAAAGPFDVVHFHAEGTALLCWLPRVFGKKVVVTVHGLDWKRAKWGKFASAYIRMSEKSAAKFADEIIVLNHENQEYFAKKYSRETTYIPNGISRPVYCPTEEITKKYKIKKDDYILYLGRLVPEKGVLQLIQSYREVKTDKKLVIAGETSDTDAYVQKLHQAAAGDGRIIFTGFVRGRVLEELFSNAYVYVLPSELEGMPLSLLEGMSYGNCCLVSDIRECLEVVEDRAVTFKKGNTEDLKEQLQRLCDNKDIVCEYRKTAADYICKKYNWDSIVENTLELYKNRRE